MKSLIKEIEEKVNEGKAMWWEEFTYHTYEEELAKDFWLKIQNQGLLEILIPSPKDLSEEELISWKKKNWGVASDIYLEDYSPESPILDWDKVKDKFRDPRCSDTYVFELSAYWDLLNPVNDSWIPHSIYDYVISKIYKAFDERDDDFYLCINFHDPFNNVCAITTNGDVERYAIGSDDRLDW